MTVLNWAQYLADCAQSVTGGEGQGQKHGVLSFLNRLAPHTLTTAGVKTSKQYLHGQLHAYFVSAVCRHACLVWLCCVF